MVTISDDERARRIANINFSRGSVALEGFKLDAEAEAINARYIAGELTSAEHIEALLALANKI